MNLTADKYTVLTSKLAFRVEHCIPKDKAVPLAPGETVTSDIKHKDTGMQRIILLCCS